MPPKHLCNKTDIEHYLDFIVAFLFPLVEAREGFNKSKYLLYDMLVINRLIVLFMA